MLVHHTNVFNANSEKPFCLSHDKVETTYAASLDLNLIDNYEICAITYDLRIVKKCYFNHFQNNYLFTD